MGVCFRWVKCFPWRFLVRNPGLWEALSVVGPVEQVRLPVTPHLPCSPSSDTGTTFTQHSWALAFPRGGGGSPEPQRAHTSCWKTTVILLWSLKLLWDWELPGTLRALNCYLKCAHSSQGVLCVGLTPTSPYPASKSLWALRSWGSPQRWSQCLEPPEGSLPACPPASTRLLSAASHSFADLGVFPSANVSISGKEFVSPLASLVKLSSGFFALILFQWVCLLQEICHKLWVRILVAE